MYTILYPCLTIHWISRFYKETRRLIIDAEEFLSLQSQSDRSAVVLAKWRGRDGIDTVGQEANSVGIVRSYFQHTIHILPQGTSEESHISFEHVLAQVDWYEDHSQRNHCGESIIVASTMSHRLTRASFVLR